MGRSLVAMVQGYDAGNREQSWQRAWERAGCFRTPTPRPGRKFFNFDSGPFVNGELHVGHARVYVLGDLTARFQRLLGRDVLYATEWDAFGLPNEMAAIAAGAQPAEFTGSWIERMKRQMLRLGLSYDWSRVRATTDPDYYGATQSLFLVMFRAGRVKRGSLPAQWCPACSTTLARMQVEDGRCWRCHGPVVQHDVPQWLIDLSGLHEEMRQRLPGLSGWSPAARNQLQAFQGDPSSLAHSTSRGPVLWSVSRQRAWGTPIPIVHCPRCGSVPSSRRRLPLKLPDDLDWSLGSRALAEHREFVETNCPRCRGSARRETDTLDCFFDDAWSWLACLREPGGPGFPTRRNLERWLPVDRFHSGLDSWVYLHLYRFVGAFLHSTGRLEQPEPVSSFLGNATVLADRRKMSTHENNAVPVAPILERDGADVLRLAVIWAAGPQRTIAWHDDLLDRARRFVFQVHELFGEVARSGVAENAAASRAASELARQSRSDIARVAQFLEEYRPNAGLDVLARLRQSLARFLSRRVATHRLGSVDAEILRGCLGDFAVALAPFAPHLAEEGWRLLRRPSLVAAARWPGGGD